MGIQSEGVALDLTCGGCPVQFEGAVDGHYAYFRARHTHWQFTIAETEEAALWGGEREGVLFDVRRHYDPDETGYGAGYMEPEEAERFILESIAAFREQAAGHQQQPTTARGER